MEEKQENKQGSKNVNKKNIIPGTAVKGLINGFISYGILLIFIFLSIIVVVTWFVNNHMETIDYNVLKYSLPLIGALIIFFLVRATCRLSTFDLFKKCQIEKDDVNKVCSKMNFFYICVVAFSVVTVLLYLMVKVGNEKVQITRDMMSYYSPSISAYAEKKEQELITKYEEERTDYLIQTIIIEMGLLSGIFSLIPNQKRLIEKYN